MFNFKEAGIVGSVLIQVLHFQLINKDKIIPGVLPFNCFSHTYLPPPSSQVMAEFERPVFFGFVFFYRSDQWSLVSSNVK